MAAKIDVYVDTSAFIAFLDKSDSHHALFRRLFADPPRLLTTNLVIAEGHAWFLRRYDVHRALQFLSLIEIMKPLRIESTSAGDRNGAIRVLRHFSDQDLTLADAVGLHLIDTREIACCWSTDFHLGLTGASLAVHTS